MATTVFRHDYQPADFAIERIDLCFELSPHATLVHATGQYRRVGKARDLCLAGRDLKLLAVKLNGAAYTDYRQDEAGLTILNAPDAFELSLTTEIDPANNTALEGLYQSSGNFCTQCEAEGFRKITYYLDRPDVLSIFTTKIIADKTQYPVLLSNGNLLETGDLPAGKHFAIWYDPFPKPCYLFALVAGDLAHIEDTFITQSGREVALYIYVQAHNISQCDFAMQSLKNAMRWDEVRFGLEYDLDIFMIVAVDDFNMGAMENKGLNIFNSKYILALPEIATDKDYMDIEAVVGHEYFHNWTGNRVTCRDWFQLSLKEGLTVFREQEFSADSRARAAKRIADVQLLRQHQFAEDKGPQAHPIRPDSYQEINNFYTLTVYEKGAEVVRMLHKILGEAGFMAGMRRYLGEFDNQAATADDFVAAMAGANDVDLRAFGNWYSQAGTPEVNVTASYDSALQQYSLHFQQHTAPTAKQADKVALPIPIDYALFAEDGRELAEHSGMFLLEQESQSLVFEHIGSRPIPSLLRGFSAPVNLNFAYSDADLALLAAVESDSFNRFEACRQLWLRALLENLAHLTHGRDMAVPAVLLEVLERILRTQGQDKALQSAALGMPLAADLDLLVAKIDPLKTEQVRRFFAEQIGKKLFKSWQEFYLENDNPEPYAPTAKQIGERALKNTCLYYLKHAPGQYGYELCLSQVQDSDNMTDKIAALTLLAEDEGAARDDVMNGFYQQYQQYKNVTDKWLAILAAAKQPRALEAGQALLSHPAYNPKNPNSVRALIGTMAHNPQVLHRADGLGYDFIGAQISAIDQQNPQLSARLCAVLNNWRQYQSPFADNMRATLVNIGSQKMSANLAEIVHNALGDAR